MEENIYITFKDLSLTREEDRALSNLLVIALTNELKSTRKDNPNLTDDEINRLLVHTPIASIFRKVDDRKYLGSFLRLTTKRHSPDDEAPLF